MIVEYIRYEIANVDAFMLAYESARVAFDESPHCVAYELSRCEEDPKSFILRIEWDSMAGHLEGFRKSAGFASFLSAVRPFIQDIREMRHYAPTAIARRISAVE